MKTITQIKYPSQYILIPCKHCGKLKSINKHYYKRNKGKHNQFCSEMCRIYNNDPKQEYIMKYINDDCFHYLIGFISTDGHIGYPGCTPSTKTYYCNIKLQKNDKDILYKIQNIFGGSIIFEGKNTCTWRVSNINFINYLKEIGITNDKTHNINLTKYFNNLPPKLKLAFLRGAIDGDGCLCIQNRETRKKPCMGLQCGFNICSASLPFILMIENYFKNGMLSERLKEQNKTATCSLYYYYINGPKIITALSDIYDINDDYLVLKRKLNMFNLIKHYYTQHK